MESYRIENLTFTYPERGAPALRGICMGIKKGSFTAICGPSGCGKTTLLRHLKPSAAPAGDISGRILFEGAPLQGLSLRDHSAKIGFVTQNPENQTVTDKVWHELAFGLESLGLKTPEIRLRVAEMASFFGIQTWFYRNVSELSGGQKQLLNLASVMAMQPSALILDEPTGQLDPIAASEFISIVGKINHELGVTVVISEHRLEEVLPLADNVAVMDGGAIIAGGAPGEVGAALRGRGHRMFHAMPAPMRIWAAVENGLPCPITVRDGREWLGQMLDGQGAAAAGANAADAAAGPDDAAGAVSGTGAVAAKGAARAASGAGATADPAAATGTGATGPVGAAQATTGTTGAQASTGAQGATAAGAGAQASTGAGAQAVPAVELDDVWFRYEKHSPDVIKGISLKAYAGEICAMLGGNGTGKTTALSLISGINKPYRGKALIDGIPVGKLEGRLFDHLLGVLPQNPQTLFVQKTVESDLMEILSDMRHSGGGEGAGSGGRGDGAQAGAGGRGGAAGGADADGAGGMADGAGAGSKRRGDGAQAGVGTGGRGGMADGAASGRGGGGGRGARLTAEEKRRRVAEVAALCRLDALLDSHPYDLSGGEQQRAALAKVLLLQPRILLLDEPTKGLDAEFKQAFARMLRGLAGAGAAIIIVSHDIEFCAEHADRCAFVFDGGIMSEGRPHELFCGNSFYTTAASRMARGRLPGAVTAGDVIAALSGRPTIGGGPDGAAGAAHEATNAPAGGGSGATAGAGAPVGAVSGAAGANDAASPPLGVTGAGDAASAAAAGSLGARRAPGLSAARRAAAVIVSLCLLGSLIFAALNFDELTDFLSGGDLSQFISISALSSYIDGGPVADTGAPPGSPDASGGPGGSGIDAGTWKYVALMLALACEAAALMFILTWRRGPTPPRLRTAAGKRAVSKRTAAAAAMILLAIPLTIYVGVYFLGDRKYYFISMLIMLEAMLPFVMVFESRKPKARELVTIAVLCAIAVAGRAAFFMLPQFKPVLALVIIAGVAFGGEAGFLVGAMTAFVSNMFFGQGPWTPWQMFSFGIIGFIAGVLFQKGLLSRGRGALCAFGGICAFLIYGMLMDTSMVLMYQSNPTKAMFLFTYMQGLPFNLIHAAATASFLFIISRAMLEKLDRVKVKYGLVA